MNILVSIRNYIDFKFKCLFDSLFSSDDFIYQYNSEHEYNHVDLSNLSELELDLNFSMYELITAIDDFLSKNYPAQILCSFSYCPKDPTKIELICKDHNLEEVRHGYSGQFKVFNHLIKLNDLLV